MDMTLNSAQGASQLGGKGRAVALDFACPHICGVVGCGASRRRCIFRIVGLIRRRWLGEAQTGQNTKGKKGFHHKRPSEE